MLYVILKFLILRFGLETQNVSLHIAAELAETALNQLDVLVLLQHQQRLPCFSWKQIIQSMTRNSASKLTNKSLAGLVHIRLETGLDTLDVHPGLDTPVAVHPLYTAVQPSQCPQ